jgi:hypothetical protein
MFESLLTAFFLESGGSFEWAHDPLDGYGTEMHLEPRIKMGAGFEFHPYRRFDVDVGAKYQAMPFGSDSKDNSFSVYLDVRFYPFKD